MFPAPSLGNSIDGGYELALQEMVGELAIQYYPSASMGGLYIFRAHEEPMDEAADKERLARLLYFLIRSEPLQRIVRDELNKITNQQAQLHFVTELLIKLVGHSLCPEMVTAANVLIGFYNNEATVRYLEKRESD